MNSPKIINGDLVIKSNDFVMTTDDEDIIQSVQAVLQTRKEEFFLDLEHGLVRDNIIGKQASQDDARDDVIEAVSQDERIESVEEIIFTDDRQKRTRTISLTLQKTDGETVQMEGVELDVG